MMTKEEILNAAKKWEDFCIALRRDFHESPELSGQETQTIARICTEYVLWDSLPSKCKMVVF